VPDLLDHAVPTGWDGSAFDPLYSGRFKHKNGATVIGLCYLREDGKCYATYGDDGIISTDDYEVLCYKPAK